jgi:hypothetical protein
MELRAIEQAIKDEIKNAKGCYMPNSPASFVKDRLHNMGKNDEAEHFWDCVVWRKTFGVDSIDALILKLNSLDKNERMPEWGTRGT